MDKKEDARLKLVITAKELAKISVEKEKTIEALKESEQKFRSLFDYINDSVFIHTLSGKILEVNDAACKELGYSKKELLLLSPRKVDSSRFAKNIPRRIKEVLKKGSSIFETVHVAKSGKEIAVEVNAKIIYFAGKRAIISICRDITERKKAERDLKENIQRYQQLFESAYDAIWMLAGAVFIDCNLRSVKLFGCGGKADLINHTPMDFSPVKQPDGLNSKQKALNYINLALTGHPQRFYWRHQKKDGTPLDVEISLNVLNLNGKKYVQAIGRDITEQKKVEEELKKAKENVDKIVVARTLELQKQTTFLSSVLENVPDMIFVKDAKDLKFELFNKAGEELLGQKRKDLIGKNDYNFFPKNQADFFVKKDRETLSNKQLVDIPEEPIDTKSGRRYLHTKKIPILNPEGKPLYLMGISEDITDRRKYEDQMKKRNIELEKFNKAAVGRELKMVELKRKISELEGQLTKFGQKNNEQK